jgi:hypothetical protein
MLGRLLDRKELVRLLLTRISHGVSSAAADPGMSAVLASLGLFEPLLSLPAGPSAARPISNPACSASLRSSVRNSG